MHIVSKNILLQYVLLSISPVMSLRGLLLATVVVFVLGSVWYSPLLFGNAWMKSAGLTEKSMKKVSKSTMLGYFVAQFFTGMVMMFVLDVFLRYGAVVSYRDGVVTAILLWLWFIATAAFGAMTWEQKWLIYYLVNVWYYLISLVLGAVILVWL